MVEAILEAAADLALTVDSGGVIRDAYLGDAYEGEDAERWVGRRWTDLVASETRPKVEELLAEARGEGVSRWRQINQALPSGEEVPVRVTGVRVDGDRIVAIGRDLQMMSTLQRRLAETQQAMERDYWRMRQLETRYRLLFQVSSEPVLTVNAESRVIVEGNQAATRLFGATVEDLVGSRLDDLFESETEIADRVQRYLTRVETQGRVEDLRIDLAGAGGEAQHLAVHANLIRQDPDAFFLVRFRDVLPGESGAGVASDLVRLVDRAPDAIAVVDGRGRIRHANRAFVELVQVSNQEEVRGEQIQRWIGRPGADLSVLDAMLESHGVVRLFSTTLRGELGSSSEVELSAVQSVGDPEVRMLVLRDVGRRLVRGPAGARTLSHAVEQLTHLVGRVSLKELVRDTVSLVERHFIDAALELTGDNRTAAAELLGVSRQSLYTKLRRYDLQGSRKGDSEDATS